MKETLQAAGEERGGLNNVNYLHALQLRQIGGYTVLCKDKVFD